MNFEVCIDYIYEWYRQSTREWCVTVYAHTDNCSMGINYTAKTLNKARHDMFRKLPNDLFRPEFKVRMENHEFDRFLAQKKG